MARRFRRIRSHCCERARRVGESGRELAGTGEQHFLASDAGDVMTGNVGGGLTHHQKGP